MECMAFDQSRKKLKLAIQSIKVQLSRAKKDRIRKRLHTMTIQQTDRIFERKNSTLSYEKSTQSIQQAIKLKQSAPLAPIYDRRWKNQEKQQLERIRSSIKLQKLASVSTAVIVSTPKTNEQKLKLRSRKSKVAIRDFLSQIKQGSIQENRKRMRLPLFKHKPSKLSKNETLSVSMGVKKQQKGIKQSVLESEKRQSKLPSFVDLSLSKFIKNKRERSNLLNLQKCLLMLDEKSKNTKPQYFGGSLQPWLTPCNETRDQFYPFHS